MLCPRRSESKKKWTSIQMNIVIFRINSSVCAILAINIFKEGDIFPGKVD